MVISKTFLWFLKPKKELAGYITFMTDAIKIKGTYLQPFFNKKGITYPYIPALKIGRLCVDKRFEGNGIGTKMLIFAMKTSTGLNDMASCRFITVDAKRNERALNFYKKRGFLALKEATGDTEPLFFDVMNVERYLESV